MSADAVDAATAATNAAIAGGDPVVIAARVRDERIERALENAGALRRAYRRNRALATECTDWAEQYAALLATIRGGGDALPPTPAATTTTTGAPS